MNERESKKQCEADPFGFALFGGKCCPMFVMYAALLPFSAVIFTSP
jgi:hypothetical protein